MTTNFIRGKNGYKKGVHLSSFRRVRRLRKTIRPRPHKRGRTRTNAVRRTRSLLWLVGSRIIGSARLRRPMREASACAWPWSNAAKLGSGSRCWDTTGTWAGCGIWMVKLYHNNMKSYAFQFPERKWNKIILGERITLNENLFVFYNWKNWEFTRSGVIACTKRD